VVRNHAKLAYNSVAGWLDGNTPAPPGVTAVKGLAENLRLQDQAAHRLKHFRQSQGALSLETVESKPIFDGDEIRDLQIQWKNRAREFIEDMMIAANGITVRFLSSRNMPSIRRVVSIPKRWDRIVEIAREYGGSLPNTPDPIALDHFLTAQKASDPDHFPDLSLAVIKLLGSGEYVAERADDSVPDHFGLAVKDYTHSTAPNRRYTDLITQRMVKSALNGSKAPYTLNELDRLAKHFTEQEDDATKIERQVNKSAAALLLEARIGEQFTGLITGASDKGTWVRLLSLPVEGRIVRGFQGVDVGDKVRVQLVSVSVEKGYIDFKKVS
jgi:exoribonuclease-2